MFYNLALKKEINPLENVQWISAPQIITSNAVERLSRLLNSATHVETRKINNVWTILYPIHLLNLTVQIKWYSPTNGVMISGKYNEYKLNFRIEGEIIHF